MAEADWFRTFFDDEYLLAYPDLEPRAPQDVEHVIRLLRLEPGAALLDLCCGQGRHAVPLAQRGLRVTGLDLSERMLEHARQRAADAGADVRWLRGDIRELAFEGEFDAIVNLFSSFGYFDSEEDDLRVLAGVRQALRPGGAFLLEMMNRDGLMRMFRPSSVMRLADGTLVLAETAFNPLAGRITEQRTWVYPDGQRTERSFAVRLYSPTELLRLFERAGLHLEAAYGGLDGSSLAHDSRRLALLARRA